jgi:dTDP-4-amino-4,6-dideoxygalactose transaminase
MGQKEKYTNICIGYQERLDEIQAAIIRVKLRHLSDWNKRRQKLAALYNKLLSELDLILPQIKEGNEHIFHVYVVRTKNRDALRSSLERNGIETQIHYPKAVHQQPVYEDLGYSDGSFPVTETITREILSLPMHPFLGEDEVQYIADTIKKIL